MIGAKIDARRRELGLTQRELAARSGLSPQYVNYLIHDKRGSRLSLRVVSGLQKALRVKQNFFTDLDAYADKKSEKATR